MSWQRKSSSRGAAASGTSRSSVRATRSRRTGTARCRGPIILLSHQRGREVPMVRLSRRSSDLPLRRTSFWPAALAVALTIGTITLADQTPAQPATQAAAAPAAPAKWVAPVKGLATAEVVRGPSKKVGNDMVTVLQVKNTSKGAIALLGVEEIWYDNSTPRKIVTGD